MPLYSHECEKCESTIDFYRPISKCSKSEQCPTCGNTTKRLYASNRLKEFPVYYDEVSKKYISSYGQERKVLKGTGRIMAKDYALPADAKEKVAHWKWRKDRGLT